MTNIVIEVPDELLQGDAVLSLHKSAINSRCYVVEVSAWDNVTAANEYYTFIKYGSGPLVDSYTVH